MSPVLIPPIPLRVPRLHSRPHPVLRGPTPRRACFVPPFPALAAPLARAPPAVPPPSCSTACVDGAAPTAPPAGIGSAAGCSAAAGCSLPTLLVSRAFCTSTRLPAATALLAPRPSTAEPAPGARELRESADAFEAGREWATEGGAAVGAGGVQRAKQEARAAGRMWYGRVSTSSTSCSRSVQRSMLGAITMSSPAHAEGSASHEDTKSWSHHQSSVDMLRKPDMAVSSHGSTSMPSGRRARADAEWSSARRAWSSGASRRTSSSTRSQSAGTSSTRGITCAAPRLSCPAPPTPRTAAGSHAVPAGRRAGKGRGAPC